MTATRRTTAAEASPTRATLVVPCYNEADRLQPARFAELLATHDALDLLLVNDGSRDATLERLEALAAEHGERVRVLDLQPNGGKGEAVRRGMLEALAGGARWVGYADADFATPPDELGRLLQTAFDAPSAVAVLGSRVAIMGADIERTVQRHYLGRVFATIASLALGQRIYDTQCGAKIFQRSEAIEAAIAAPFTSRWAFDVELLGRLIRASRSAHDGLHEIIEVPLRVWRDVGGSKLSGQAMLKAGVDLGAIAWKLRRGG